MAGDMLRPYRAQWSAVADGVDIIDDVVYFGAELWLPGLMLVPVFVLVVSLVLWTRKRPEVRSALFAVASTMTRPTFGRAVVRQEANRLQPGLYVHAGGRVWRHWCAWVPESVLRSKGRRMPWKPPNMSPRSQLAYVGRLLAASLAPGVVWVRRGDPDGYSVAVAAVGGDRLLLDSDAGRVARRIRATTVNAEQLRLRERWSRHVDSPRFKAVEPDLVVEEFIEGTELPSLGPFEQVEACIALFASSSNLTRWEGEGNAQELLVSLLDTELRSRLDPVLNEALPPAETIVRAGSWPFVPGFLDHTAGHVLVGEDQRPVIIDCIPMRWVPFFYGPLFLFAGSQRVPRLRAAYSSGELDDALAALFEAAGCDLNPSPHTRRALLALTILLRQQEAGFADPARVAARANRLVRARDCAELLAGR